MHHIATFSLMVDGAVGASPAGAPVDRIVFVGHSTVLIEIEGVRVLTDPVLVGRVGHLRRHAPLVEERVFAEPDAVLISHLHHDHLDLASLRRLGHKTPSIVPAGAGGWLARKGFEFVTELSLGESTSVNTLTVTAVEAVHDGRRLGGPRAESIGYLVQGRRIVYFAGDTGLFGGMKNFVPSPDVALVPVAGWGPRLGSGHMSSAEAAKAVALIAPRIAIPVHWGTFARIGLARHHRERSGDVPRRFAEEVANLAPDVEVRILTPGEGTEL
jgi:L-ascorbate metabolism protein UlaG (beta-lactamase superfamily)